MTRSGRLRSTFVASTCGASCFSAAPHALRLIAVARPTASARRRRARGTVVVMAATLPDRGDGRVRRAVPVIPAVPRRVRRRVQRREQRRVDEIDLDPRRPPLVVAKDTLAAPAHLRPVADEAGE